ncbi:MAG TPA: hypothetical protein VF384_12375 [Planctomycetota bacterium]
MLRRLDVLALLLPVLPAAAQDGRRHGPEHNLRGLPASAAAFVPYHQESEHALNRLFRLLWLAELTPSEVGTVVDPGERRWTAGWVHEKRAGTAADRRLFGGDGRLLPLEDLTADAVDASSTLLRDLIANADLRRELLARPELAVLCQHDLLRAAERLLDVGRHQDIVPLLHRASLAIALPAATLASLRDPLRLLLADAAGKDLAAALPTALGGRDASLREVTRRSTRLFDAEKTLLWSSVFLAHPDGVDALGAMLPEALTGEAAKKGPMVPVGFRAVLVQGLVAVDADGRPRATPLVFDVRTQRLANREPLAAGNTTFTHDGIDFGIWQLERQGLRLGVPAGFFRRIEADDQDLFRDYGTAKHTTYRGQCALCHRLSGTPEPHLGGFPVLRPHAGAAFAKTGDERRTLAEQQVQKLLDRLAAVR